MQDPSLYSQIKSHVEHPQPQFPEQEHLTCPRCDSTNTKFCYFNNYNLSQPRHYCKNCRRYWTKGGALRNIPVGGGSRKNAKRSSASSASASKRPLAPAPAPVPVAPPSVSDTQSETRSGNSAEITETAAMPGKGDTFVGHFGTLLDGSETFGSLLGASGGQFGHFLNGLGPNGSSLVDHFGDPGPGQNMDRLMYDHGSSNSNHGDGFMGIHGGHGRGGGDGGEADCWGDCGTAWPDLAIYTPRSNFQ